MDSTPCMLVATTVCPEVQAKCMTTHATYVMRGGILFYVLTHRNSAGRYISQVQIAAVVLTGIPLSLAFGSQISL